MVEVNILVFMFFMHFLFDYYIQSRSNVNIKSIDWWKKRHPHNMLKARLCCLFGLFMHSFVWSYAVLSPFIFYTWRSDVIYDVYICLLITAEVHIIIDNAKTNKKQISSIVDQFLHIIQIILAWKVCILLIN